MGFSACIIKTILDNDFMVQCALGLFSLEDNVAGDGSGDFPSTSFSFLSFAVRDTSLAPALLILSKTCVKVVEKQSIKHL